MSELKPCPFCGTTARIFGGPMAQERYSIWCNNYHHIEYGMNEQETIDAWNTRHIPEGYALVPVEPSEAIKLAFIECYERRIYDVSSIYKAMIKAA